MRRQTLRNPEPGRGVRYRTLTVPAAVVERVPEGTEFVCELIADGILFRQGERRDFGTLDGAGDVPIRLQGGFTTLTPYGCTYCGNAFWTEADRARRLPAGLHPCPHCGELSRVQEDRYARGGRD